MIKDVSLIAHICLSGNLGPIRHTSPVCQDNLCIHVAFQTINRLEQHYLSVLSRNGNDLLVDA